jgi:hypothetical protein
VTPPPAAPVAWPHSGRCRAVVASRRLRRRAAFGRRRCLAAGRRRAALVRVRRAVGICVCLAQDLASSAALAESSVGGKAREAGAPCVRRPALCDLSRPAEKPHRSGVAQRGGFHSDACSERWRDRRQSRAEHSRLHPCPLIQGTVVWALPYLPNTALKSRTAARGPFG